MPTLKEQQNVFKQGKQLDPRDISANVFLGAPKIDDKANVFLGSVPLHPSANVFVRGQIPLHESARDFMESSE